MNSNNDHSLKQDILDELGWEPSISADHIGITVKDGVVTLSGFVDNYWQKHAAETAVGRVKGVKAIAEEIEVRLPDSIQNSDEDIAAAALNRLMWDVSLPRDAIKVRVEKGFVTLTGQMEWHYQRERAADDIRSLMGVTGVANQTTVKNYPNVQNITKGIEKALHRSWYDFDKISVSADDGKVQLTGDVDSWTDKQTAGAIAWAAAGTTGVQNNIRII